MPIAASPGEHKLTVEGLVNGRNGLSVFKNVTKVVFDTKYVSLFIQTNVPVYYPPQTGRFGFILSWLSKKGHDNVINNRSV